MDTAKLLKSRVAMKVVLNTLSKGHVTVTKYKPLLNELSQVNYSSGEIISLVFSSLGTKISNTNKNLKKLHLSKQKDTLPMTVTKGSQQPAIAKGSNNQHSPQSL